MSNNPTIKGDSTIQWGTASGTTITGIIVRVRNQLTGEMVEVSDVNGFTTALVLFNHKNELEAEMITQTSVPALSRGTVVTIMSIATAIVTEVEQVWEQKQVQKFTVKATAFSGISSP